MGIKLPTIVAKASGRRKSSRHHQRKTYHVAVTPSEIKALRLSLNLSQEQFAQKLGVSYPSVNRWEQGRSKPNPSLEFWSAKCEYRKIDIC